MMGEVSGSQKLDERGPLGVSVNNSSMVSTMGSTMGSTSIVLSVLS